MLLTQLRTFVAVYRTGSFTGAAHLLGLSQPAVSGQIKQLEQALGRRLFVRAPAGAVPTAPGHELARQVGGHVDALEAVLRRHLEPAELADTVVRLAGPSEFVSDIVLPATADLAASGLRLRVALGLTEPLLRGLELDEHDIVVATGPPRSSALDAVPLLDEELALVAPRHVACEVTHERIEADGADAVAHLPLVTYADRLPLIRRYWTGVFGVPPPTGAQIVVPDLRAVLAATLACGGVTVLPTYLCAGALERGELVVLHHPAALPTNTLYLVTRLADVDQPVIATVRDHLVAHIRGPRG